MKNSIAALIALSFSAFAAGQAFIKKDTLRFAPDSSYARAIARQGENLLLGTSKNGVISLNEKSGATTVIVPPSPSGEFRSVAVGKRGVYALTSGDNGEIWVVKNGQAERIVFAPGAFFDDLKTAGSALVFLGDPDSSGFVLGKLNEPSGTIVSLHPPKPFPGEACYAASASTLFMFSSGKIAFISGGGNNARFHFTSNGGKAWTSVNLPMNGSDGCGPFSVYFTGRKTGMIVGGCYTQPNERQNSSLYTADGGKTWQVSEKTTNGYRSCVTGNRRVQFACGTNGIDVSTDGGKTWELFDNGNFCALLLENGTLYATTAKGFLVRYALR